MTATRPLHPPVVRAPRGRSASDARPGRLLYRWLGRHAFLVDAVVAGALLLLVAFFYVVAMRGESGAALASMIRDLLVQVALILPFAWRRVRPGAAAIAAAVPCVVQVVFALPLGPGEVVVLFVIEGVAAYASRRSAWLGLAAGLTGIALLAVRYASVLGAAGDSIVTMAFLLISGWALVGVAWLIGDVGRARRMEREALAERAVRAERDRARDRELAAAEERRHIARELHDVIAHSLAVVVTQADGARFAAAGTPGPAVPALEHISEAARASLADMRRLLGVLRDGPGGGTTPAPGLPDIGPLVETVRASGLRVRCTTSGTPRPLPAGAELVLYRVAQEALTNVLKHAGEGVSAVVALDWEEDEVRLTVTDTGSGPGDGAGTGHGLLGMRERLGLYGGDCRFGPAVGGGAELAARLPLKDAGA